MAELELSEYFKELDRTFDATKQGIPTWFAENYWIPFTAVAVYVLFIFIVPHLVSKPLPGFRMLFGLWNLVLSIFSFVGMFYVVPDLLSRSYEHGMRFTLCADPNEFAGRGLHGFFLVLFASSKVPELLDTVFLVLLKKDVMFLHWYHHITVLLYSWHGYAAANAIGPYSSGMNYTVHAIMYFYFFASTLCKDSWWYRNLMAPYSTWITLIQLWQMVGGMVLLGMVSYYKWFSEDVTHCHMTDANIYLGALMYFSYFVLFMKLYYDKVSRSKASSHAKRSKKTK